MTYRVIIQPRAERDIWAAAQWIEDESKSAAKALRWVRGIRAKIETLKANPNRCPVDSDSDAFGGMRAKPSRCICGSPAGSRVRELV